MQLPMEERRGPLFSALFARAAGPVMRRGPGADHRSRPTRRGGARGGRARPSHRWPPHAASRSSRWPSVACCPNAARARGDRTICGPLWQAEGLGDPSWADVYGQMYLHPFPPSFGQRPDSSVVRPIRPDRGSPRSADSRRLGGVARRRPTVRVRDLGNRTHLDRPFRGASCSQCRGLDVDAVATIGPHVDPADVGPVPPNVRVERFVPQADCSAGQRSRDLPRRRRHGARRCLARPAAIRRAAVRRPVGERRRRRRCRLRHVLADPDNRSVDDIDAGVAHAARRLVTP